MLRKFLYKLAYKKVKKEVEELECFFERQSERYAALGNDDDEDEIKRNKELTENFNKIYKKYEELEMLLNK